MDQPKILVAIRKRPLSKREQSRCETDIISVKNGQTIIVSQYKQKVDLTKFIQQTVFNFDFAFHEDSTNEQVYEEAVKPLVNSAFEGAKITCFAYGQTGSGKTYTMNGSQRMGVQGLYTLGAIDIFHYLNSSQFGHLTARLSFFEIYCGKLFDLLNKRQELTLREDNKQNINIIGLEQIQIDSFDKFQELLVYGSTQRVTSQNSANSESSRSHAILQIVLKDGKKVYGKISFIDLAGNERGADHTDMKKQTRIDGAEINKSLLSLKECIRALDQGKGHTPFRGSKLTMVLKDSFVGFCRTVMIGNISPSSASSENTLNTLRYADRVKQLRKPSQCLTKEQQRAKQMMLPRQNNNAIRIDITKDDDADDIQAKRRQAEKNYGIREEMSTNLKQFQRQMITDPNRRTDNQRSRKQSFGGPTIQGTNIKNGIVPSGTKQPQQQQPQPQQIVSLQPIHQPKSPSISNQKGKIEQPSKNNQRVVVGNEKNVYPSSNSSFQQQQPFPHDNSQIIIKNCSTYFNNSKCGSSNHESRMDIEEAMVTPPQVFIRQSNNNFMQSNQQITPRCNIINPPTNSANNIPINPQPIYQQVQVPPANPRTHQFYGQSDRLNQYRSNFHPLDQRTSGVLHLSNRLAQAPVILPQKIIVPQTWDAMIDFVSTTTDQQLRHRVHQRIHEQLFQDQNDLISSHSDTLRSSLDCLKSEMSLIADLQNNRDAVTTREYLHLMQESIDEKMSLLEMLREKMVQFTYKLERVQEIDQRSENVEPRGYEDEQLLDDLH